MPIPAPKNWAGSIRPQLAIHASPQAFAAALDTLKPRRAPHDVSAAHQDYLDWSEKPLPQPGAVNLSEIMVWLRGHLPDDAILCNGAGNYSGWIHRFYRFRRFGTQIGTDLRLHGLWRAGRGGDEGAVSRSAPCWRSMAMAIS